MILHIGVGLAGAAAVALTAYWARALSGSGAIAAALVGGTLYALGGLLWYGLLMVFFVTSTGWSKWKKARKQAAEQSYEKGSRRDAGQVLANGGLGALICIACYMKPDPGWVYAFIGVMASVNADTWATEIGGMSKGMPRSIITGKRVPRGTSGGVSWLGSVAAAAGAVTIGAAGALTLLVAGDAGNHSRLVMGLDGWTSGLLILLIALVGGLVGAFSDSLMGATVQRMNRCAVCGNELEQDRHCGQTAIHARGWSWMNNDRVNAISSLLGGSAAWAAGICLF